jgi:hypothetical protein
VGKTGVAAKKGQRGERATTRVSLWEKRNDATYDSNLASNNPHSRTEDQPLATYFLGYYRRPQGAPCPRLTPLALVRLAVVRVTRLVMPPRPHPSRHDARGASHDAPLALVRLIVMRVTRLVTPPHACSASPHPTAPR